MAVNRILAVYRDAIANSCGFRGETGWSIPVERDDLIELLEAYERDLALTADLEQRRARLRERNNQ